MTTTNSNVFTEIYNTVTCAADYPVLAPSVGSVVLVPVESFLHFSVFLPVRTALHSQLQDTTDGH